MSDYLKSNWVLILSFLFIMANSALIAMEEYWFSAIPFVLAIILLAIVAMDKLLYIVVFATPLSLNLEELNFGGIGMFFPTEPLLFGIMIIFFLRLLYDRKYSKVVLKHPISIAIYINLIWILLTALTSTMPIISFKFLLARLWFVVAMYFVGYHIFQYKKNILTFFWVYLVPLSIVAIYTFTHHSMYGFDERSAHWVMEPFFKDHTVYGAILAMMFPIVLCLLVLKRYRRQRIIIIGMTIALLLGIIFSYGRAAWLSLAAAIIVSIIYLIRIKGSVIISLSVLLIIIGAFFWTDIIGVLQQNTQDSTSATLGQHVESITNISTDASNLERINRWNSAIRMFYEKPMLGWGPGTYMFQYAPFQSPEDLTIISTNAGDLGNAHSEFLGPLAEEGIMGLLSFVLILVMFYVTASKLYYNLPKSELRTIVFFVILAFTTYVINGVLNNFLDTDKASIPFWGFIAIIMSIDIHRKKMLKKEIEQLEA